MTVRFTVRQITSDGHGLLLDGELHGGTLEAGDHLAFSDDERQRPHLHVVRVDPGPGASGLASLLVDAHSSSLIDTHTVLTRVPPLSSATLLPMRGLPAGVEFADREEPAPVPLPLAPEEAAGSGPGYDALK